jgi:hypothetical protein
MSKSSAQEALFDEVERQTKEIAEARNLNILNQAAALKDLAAAYRLTAGGAQPGSSVISS